jgi:DNA replication ATP-dependent helicase Dna2
MMLKNIKSANNEGLDRKLNVALTRAKEQIIILGDKNTLSSDIFYKNVIDKCTIVESQKYL